MSDLDWYYLRAIPLTCLWLAKSCLRWRSLDGPRMELECMEDIE